MTVMIILASGAAAFAAVAAAAMLVHPERVTERLAPRLDGILRPAREYAAGRPVERRDRLRMGGLVAIVCFTCGAVAIDPVAGALLALAAPIFGVRLHRTMCDRRRARLDRQVGEVATSMANALAAGQAIRQAVAGAAKEVDEPAGAELRRAASELALGAATDRALRAAASRSGSNRLSVLVAATEIQRTAGGNLAVLLRELARHESDRLRLEGEARAASAQARFTGKIVVAMPIVAAGILEFLDPGFIGSLFGSFLAAWLLGAAAILQLVGGLSIARISRTP